MRVTLGPSSLFHNHASSRSAYKETGETDRWYVTNLPREQWDVDAISTSYRLRWLVERAFRRMKHVARMDHLQTSRSTAVMALLGAALLVSTLAERVHHQLAREEGITKVRLERCQLIVTSALSRIVQLLIYEYVGRVLHFDAIARIVTHESRHPNPRQPHLVGPSDERSEAGLSLSEN